MTCLQTGAGTDVAVAVFFHLQTMRFSIWHLSDLPADGAGEEVAVAVSNSPANDAVLQRVLRESRWRTARALALQTVIKNDRAWLQHGWPVIVLCWASHADCQ